MKSIYILLLTLFLGFTFSETFAQSNPCMAVDSPFSVVYKVNNKVVPTLQGFVTPGSVVTVTLTRKLINPRVGIARYSLVSYTTENPNYDTTRAILYHVYQYETIDAPMGTHILSIREP